MPSTKHLVPNYTTQHSKKKYKKRNVERGTSRQNIRTNQNTPLHGTYTRNGRMSQSTPTPRFFQFITTPPSPAPRSSLKAPPTHAHLIRNHAARLAAHRLRVRQSLERPPRLMKLLLLDLQMRQLLLLLRRTRSRRLRRGRGLRRTLFLRSGPDDGAVRAGAHAVRSAHLVLAEIKPFLLVDGRQLEKCAKITKSGLGRG